MSILIKGMEMPENCLECPLVVCLSVESDCPLVHIPPHGRLIDADKFTALVFADPYQDFVHIIEQMPTIIPAEESE